MPAKRFKHAHAPGHEWSQEKSAAVMKKLTEERGRGDAIPMDPAVEAVRDSLEENLVFFMTNVAAMSAKYRDALAACVPPQYIHAERKQVPLPELGDEGSFHELRESVIKESERVANAAEGADKDSAVTVAGPPAPDRGRVIQLLIVEEDAEAEEGDEEADDDDDDDSDEEEDDEDAAVGEDAPEIVLPDNRLLLTQLHTIKREAYALNTTFNGIHDWVAFNIPTDPSEGATAEVMAAVMAQTLALSEALTSIYEMESRYLAERLGAETGAQRHPDCYSMQDAMLSNEVETWDELKRAWWTMQRVTMIEHTVLAKNMKILTRGVSREHERLFV